MAKKLDQKSAALVAAQGSGAVFEALNDDEAPAAAEAQAQPQAQAGPKPQPAPKADDDNGRDDARTETPKMNTQTFNPAVGMDAVAERMRGMMDGKSVVERTQQLAQEAAELAKGNLEAMLASSRIAAQNAGTFGQEAAELGRKSFEGASEAMKSFAEAKSPTELLRLQSEFAKTYLETMFAEGARMSETMVKLAGEAMQPVQSRVAANVEKVKSITQ